MIGSIDEDSSSLPHHLSLDVEDELELNNNLMKLKNLYSDGLR